MFNTKSYCLKLNFVVNLKMWEDKKGLNLSYVVKSLLSIKA